VLNLQQGVPVTCAFGDAETNAVVCPSVSLNHAVFNRPPALKKFGGVVRTATSGDLRIIVVIRQLSPATLNGYLVSPVLVCPHLTPVLPLG
jgi:hypothetical protein